MGYLNRNVLILVMMLLALTACSNPEAKSQELYETAQFEEQQRNIPHAKKLYERIVSDYPETATAGKAKERLKALESAPSPSP
jgi:outer membrane protein assembly factor BamD (BamD/ComL family)